MGLVSYATKECKFCGGEYKPKSVTQLFCCADCREDYKISEQTKKKNYDPVAKFTPVMSFIKQHYEETGQYLHYGQAVALMELKKKTKRSGKKR